MKSYLEFQCLFSECIKRKEKKTLHFTECIKPPHTLRKPPNTDKYQMRLNWETVHKLTVKITSKQNDPQTTRVANRGARGGGEMRWGDHPMTNPAAQNQILMVIDLPVELEPGLSSSLL